ncbi:MAG: OmpA family protein [Pseudomonadales bacterium]|nr:OmpA family protein [Pseudomonadales bacterium]
MLIYSTFYSTFAAGLTYVSALEDSRWETTTSRYECVLSHMIEGYGKGEFIHRAGEGRIFRLTGQSFAFRQAPASILSVPPTWLPGRASTVLMTSPAPPPQLEYNGDITTRMAAELLRGMLVVVQGELDEVEGEPLAVTLMTAGFTQAYEDFQRCEVNLLPVNFAQIERIRIQYSGGETDVPATDQGLLRKVAAYLQVDDSVRSIYVDGHTDGEGLSKDNIVVSEKRAVAVTQYLESLGVPADMIVTRYHGESYPVAPNTTAANRARNRRTTVRLSREPPVFPETEKTPEETEAEKAELAQKSG